MTQKAKQLVDFLRQTLHVTDPHQRTALARLVRFFAVMLVLTLIARGTATASTPTVTAAHPAKGTILQTVPVEGLIAAAGSAVVRVPAQLTVQNTLVKNGEQVQAGQPLADFDPREIAAQLALKTAELKKMQTDHAQLGTAKNPDATSVSAAQQALDWAYADAKAAADALAALQSEIPPNDAAIAAAQEKEASAQRAAEGAEQARNAALAAYQAAEAEAKNTAQSRAAEAEILAVNILIKQESLAALQALQQSGGVLCAPFAGTVKNLALIAGQTTGEAACNLADAAQGYSLEFTLDSESAAYAQTGNPITVRQKERTEELTVSAVTLNEDGTVHLTVRLPQAAWQEGVATGTMTLSQTTHALCVPSAAVHQDNAGPFVYVAEEQNTVLGAQMVLVRIPVTVAEIGSTLTGIEGPFNEKSIVIAASDRPLAEGARVRIAS